MKTINTTQLNLGSELSKKLMFLRKKSALTRKKLAELSGIGEDTIRSWERAARIPTISNLIGLLEVYKKRGITVNSLDWFINGQIDIEETSEIVEIDNTSISELLLHDKETFKLAYKKATTILDEQNSKYSILDLFSELLNQYKNILLKQNNVRVKSE